MAVTLRQLGYFVALAEEGHFGRAAARVHVTQPALSMQIRELEDTLKVALVERGPREARLTPAGRDLVIRARRVLAEVEAITAQAAQQAMAARLHLGVIPTVAPYLLPQALPLLRARDITRDLRLREATTDVLLADLARGHIDAAVIASADLPDGMVAQVLFQDRFLLAGSPARLAALSAGPEALRPRALDPDQLLLLDEGHCLADQALEVCGLDRSRRRLDLGAASLSTLCGLVRQGLGLTFLPEIAIAAEAAALPELACLRFAPPEPQRDIALVRRVTTPPDGWFAEVAQVLGQAGKTLIGNVPPHLHRAA